MNFTTTFQTRVMVDVIVPVKDSLSTTVNEEFDISTVQLTGTHQGAVWTEPQHPQRLLCFEVFFIINNINVGSRIMNLELNLAYRV